MTHSILVTGGTGTLGRLLVPRLRAAGHEVRVLSRGAGAGLWTGDLVTGAGVAAAVDGVDTVVHCAGTAKGDGAKARTLVDAIGAARPHLVFISVVGADRVPMAGRADRAMFGYYGSKRDAELVVEGSGLPWTTLRTTQFHELILTVMRKAAVLPVVPLPAGMRAQPVDAGEVADRMAELAVGRPAGLVPDLGGPAVHTLPELLRAYLDQVGKRRRTVPLPAPGQAAAALRDGANLTTPDRATGTRTWADFVTAAR